MSEPSYPLCAREACKRPMRPRGYTAEMAPGTVAMGHGGECKSCVQPRPRRKSATPPVSRRKEPSGQDQRAADTINGLRSFYARRYARGIAPEGIPPIRGELVRQAATPAVTGPAIIHIPAPKKEISASGKAGRTSGRQVQVR